MLVVNPVRMPMDTIECSVTEFHGADGQCRGTVADLMLDAHMIPPCGLIPPFRVVAGVIRSGGSRGGMSSGTPDELKCWHRDPHIVGEIQPDHSAPDTDDYLVWLDSLVQRGHLPGGPFREARR